MLRHCLLRPFLAALLALVFSTSSFPRGQFWNFLGYTQVDAGHDHGKIQVSRHDRPFRTIQLRVTGAAIFFDRVVVHFGNGTLQELVVNDRISPGGRDYVMDLPGERGGLESVELWYYKEPWGRNPRVSLYGIRSPEPDGESMAWAQ
jgi:hypothetical protein